ncbi:MAG: hypothetical protein RL060_1771 [Bacteroidota bacterium]|jgi:NAD(P)H-hydrate epimerase
MMKIFSSQIRHQWDDFTIQNEPIASVALMERAAKTCTDWLLTHFSGHHFAIVCGPGNNGGDGLAIARLLHLAHQKISVFKVQSAQHTDDFLTNLKQITSLGISITENSTDFLKTCAAQTVFIDALFGTGLNKALHGQAADLVQTLNETPGIKIAIDIPSGLAADGKLADFSIAFQAMHTLTFQSPKLSFMYPENEVYVGQFHVLAIGLSKAFETNTPSMYQYLQAADIDFIKPRAKFAHKGTFGHALLIAGSKGKMGAAIMAAQACLQSGVGLLTTCCAEIGQDIIQIAVPAAMSKTYEDTIDFDNYTSIGIGPGISTSAEANQILVSLLAQYTKPIVVDADALSLLGIGHELSMLSANSILTPHPKEFDRLFGHSDSRAHQIQKGLDFAAQHQVYILLKGAHTAIICPEGEVIFNSTGNPAMAKGGSGDVLTGMLTAFLAQGYSSKESCILGVYLHGLAADLALLKTSAWSMLPQDLIAHIGEAFLVVSK